MTNIEASKKVCNKYRSNGFHIHSETAIPPRKWFSKSPAPGRIWNSGKRICLFGLNICVWMQTIVGDKLFGAGLVSDPQQWHM
jgi:hypothetical protein